MRLRILTRQVGNLLRKPGGGAGVCPRAEPSQRLFTVAIAPVANPKAQQLIDPL
ncbi:hypothetical protein [Thermoleptolyngbya sp.]